MDLKHEISGVDAATNKESPVPSSSPTKDGNSPVAPQSIIEVAHGSDGTAAGPKYKRGRGRSFFSEAPKKGAICQVPACDRQLHKLKDYYKRYKICPYHLELAQLVVEGQSIRFCQQCGRFQLLDDFDGDRRSCRRKLEKHNARRRRFEVSSDGSGEYGSAQRRQKSSNSPPPQTNGTHANGRKAGNGAFEPAVHQLAEDEEFTQAISPQLRMGMHNGLAKHAEAPTAWASEHQRPVDAGFASMNPALAAVLGETLLPEQQRSGWQPYQQTVPVQQQQQQQPEHTSNPLLQALLDQVERSNQLEGAEMQPPARQQSLEAPNGLIARTGSGFAPPVPAAAFQPPMVHQPIATRPPAPRPAAFQPPAPAALDANPHMAQQLLSFIGRIINSTTPSGPNNQEQHLITLSMKLFNAHPSQLPHGVVQELTSWMISNPSYVELATRPGCIHITATALVTEHERDFLAATFVDNLKKMLVVKNELLQDGVAGGEVLIQLRTSSNAAPQAAIIYGGELKALLSCPESGHEEGGTGLRAAITAARPLAILPDYTGSVVLFTEGGKGQTERGLVCRSHDEHPTVEVLASGPTYVDRETGEPREDAHQRWMQLNLPGPLKVGAYKFELQQNAMLSAAQTVAILPNAEAVAEVRQLELDSSGVEDVPGFLHKLGIVLRSVDRLSSLDESTSSQGYSPPPTEAEIMSVVSAACDIISVCIDRSWPAVLALCLPAALQQGIEVAAAGIARRLGTTHRGVLANALQGYCGGSLDGAIASWNNNAGTNAEADADCVIGGSTDGDGSLNSDQASGSSSPNSTLPRVVAVGKNDRCKGGIPVEELAHHLSAAHAAPSTRTPDWSIVQWALCVMVLEIGLQALLLATGPDHLPLHFLVSSILSMVMFSLLCVVLFAAASSKRRSASVAWLAVAFVMIAGVWHVNPVSKVAPGPAAFPLLLLVAAAVQAQLSENAARMGCATAHNKAINKYDVGSEADYLNDYSKPVKQLKDGKEV